jgi:hypothetical protein
MKKWLITGSVVSIVALVGVMAWSSLALAQGPGGGGSFFGRGGIGAGPAMGRSGFGEGPFFGHGQFGSTIDHEALLAEALGITVDELEAAQEQAHAAAIQQALDQGLITQEQADWMSSRMKLRDYLDRDALTAQALGITVEELQQARTDGKPLAVLIYELQLDPATVRINMQSAYEAAIQQAVTDGVITQEQADQILAGRGFGGRGGFAGPGGFGQFGGPRGFGRFGGFGRQ